MGLFIVNRHEENYTEDLPSDEKNKLSVLLKKVEKKKLNKQKLKEKKKRTYEVQKQIVQREFERRQLKKTLKAQIVPVIENNTEFIDENIIIKSVEKELEVEPHVEITKSKENKKKDVLEGFTILGSDDFKKKKKVKRVLPKWLSNPKVISVDLQNLQTKTSSIKLLNKHLRRKLKELGIKYLFPVQAEVIPWLLNCNKIRESIQPNDICVSAPTGSGKTLAFVLPIVQALQNNITKHIRALVILPTQSLALQVFKAFKVFTADSDINVCLISGKSSFEQEQKQLLHKDAAFGYLGKVDILICTAGRLVDHLKMTPGFTLEHLQFLVIDEADRVLDSVQNDWLYHLEKHIHKDGSNSSRILNLKQLSTHRPPQKLLFSATLSQDPEKLQKLGLFQPKLFTSIIEGAEEPEDNISERFVGKYTTPKELTEKYIICSKDVRPLVLYEFMSSEALTKTLVFTYSLDSAHRLTVLLRSLFKETKTVQQIGSNLNPNLRNKLIDDFDKGKIDILVCTDALARGIDLAGVKCVVSYSVPKHLKTYIHRVGRTARAGEQGLAVTLIDKNQIPKFQMLLQQGSKNNLKEIAVDIEKLEPLVKQYQEALASLKDTIEKEEAMDLKKIKLGKRSNKKRKRDE